MSILVASTVAPHVALAGAELDWLHNAEQIRDSHPEGVEFFCAVEVDGRGPGIFRRLLDRLEDLKGEWWTYHLDQTCQYQVLESAHSTRSGQGEGRNEVRTGERHVRVVTGRNLGIEKGLRSGASHVLFLDADVRAPDDALPKLLEVDWPVVFGHIPTYGLDGPRMTTWADIGRSALPMDSHGATMEWWPREHRLADPLPGDVRRHWSSAGCVLVAREVIRYVSWGHDPDDRGLSDDPRFARDAGCMGFGPVLTRHDCVARHVPEVILPLEARGRDRVLRPITWPED